MGKQSYLAPVMKCRAKFFLKDEFGQHTPWKDEVWGNRTDSKLADKRMSLVLTNNDPDACRETLCNDFLEFFRELDGEAVIPADRILTLQPPTDRRGKPTVKDTLVLEYKISGPEFPSSNIFNHMGDSCDNAYYTPAFQLATTKERQRELFRLLDAVLGPAAMLMCGPRAYVRSGSNKLPDTKITYGRDYDGWGYGYTLDYGYDYDDTKYKEDSYRFAESWFKYNGLSSLVFKHPVILSLIFGLGRFCFELYLDGKYETLNKTLNITAVRQRLNLLKHKKSLSAQDKKWLFQRLYRLYPYFSTKKVRENLGAYPLNTYTWSMFRKFVQEMEKPQSFVQSWQAAPRDFYGASNYGFYQWCKQHKKPTKQFLKAGKNARHWGGTNGNMVYL